jgi:hypothetical protein
VLYPQLDKIATYFIGMRIDWVTQKARVDRWEEEIDRLRTEMECGVRWFEYRQQWWFQKVGKRLDLSSDIISGIDAYAHRQADIARRIAESYVASWRPILQKNGFDSPWSLEVYPEWEGREVDDVALGHGIGSEFSDSDIDEQLAPLKNLRVGDSSNFEFD